VTAAPGRGRRWRTWSLTARLAWRLAAVMLCTILLAAAAVAWRTVATLHDLDDAAMLQQVEFLIRHLPKGAPDQPFELPRDVTDRFRLSDGDTVFLILGPGGRLLSSSDPDETAILSPLLPDPIEPGFLRLPPTPGHPQGLMGFARSAGGRLVILLQGREQADAVVDSLTTEFLGADVWLLLPIGLLMLGVSIVTLRRGLRPLTRASAAAAAIGPGEPGRRLPAEGLPREVTPLVDAVNEALSRLERTIAAQRSFMAQAAHGLRTPLAVLTARLDGMADTPEVRGLRHDSDRMSRLVSQLLRMARLESLPLDLSETVDLHGVAAEAVAGLAPLAIRDGVELALTGETALTVTGNRAALLLAIINLVENALGYAPRGSTVEVELRAPQDIAVCDRGPGIAPGQEARLLRPFERGSDAREGGAGLGLAIVAEIAAAHGGRLRLTAREGGGTEALLSLGTADTTASEDAPPLAR
jgi:two-component system sensor histidine kinase TctE